MAATLRVVDADSDRWDELVREGRKLSKIRWDEMVLEGIALVIADRGDTKFTLGDLAIEVEPPGEHGVHTGGNTRLSEYADAIGITFDQLRKYRQVAVGWPDGTRVPSVPWTAHRALMAYPDRAELIGTREWTPAALAELRQERKPKAMPPRDERWWIAQQAALKELRTWTPERIRRLNPAERRRRAPFMKEEAELAAKVAAELEITGKDVKL